MYQQMYRQPPPEESIYNLIPPDEVVRVKAPMYVSKYPSNLAPTASTFGRTVAGQFKTTNMAGEWKPTPISHNHEKLGATFGPKKSQRPAPSSFLKKNTKPSIPEPTGPYQKHHNLAALPVSSMSSLPTITPTKQRNYVQQNALAAITQVPGNRREPEKRFVDKPGYGQSPGYLGEVKQQIEAEKEYVRRAMDQEREQYEMGQTHRRLLSEEERMELLENLKTKWEVVNKLYQAMTHQVVLDTIGKVRRKEDYEKQLEYLEKSVEKLSKKFVFVEA